MIGSALFGKAGLIAILVGAGGLLGITFSQRVLVPKASEKIDYAEIRTIIASELQAMPQPTVSVQPFDVDKIKGIREFNYSPQFSGSIQVSGVDSTSVRRYIREAVAIALSNQKRSK